MQRYKQRNDIGSRTSATSNLRCFASHRGAFTTSPKLRSESKPNGSLIIYPPLGWRTTLTTK